MQFTVLVLLCSLAMPTGRCDETNAVDVIASRVPSELGCSQNWQTLIARGSLREGVGDTLYVKTVCRRRREGRQATLSPEVSN